MAETQPKMTSITLLVKLKEVVSDPHGQAMKESLHRLGFTGVSGVKTGKVIDLELVGELSPPEVDSFVEKTEAAGFIQHPLIETVDFQGK